MRKISIIVPCYNSLKTLSSTLSSISMQTIKDKCIVYLCDDCGEDSYSSLIERYGNILKVVYLRLPVNQGSGRARQFGIDCSNEKYIVFIDSDDTLANQFSLEIMYNKMMQSHSDVIVSSFMSDIRDGCEISFKKYSKSITWLHGKLYRRQFLVDNNISFNNLRINEDCYFNQLINLYHPKIEYLDTVTYLWVSNPESITRQNKSTNRYEILTAYIESCYELFKETEKRNLHTTKASIQQTLSGFILLYFYFNEIRVSMEKMFYNQYLENCKKYYRDCYSKVENYISTEDMQFMYSSILNQSDEFKNIMPFTSLYEFCSMMN